MADLRQKLLSDPAMALELASPHIAMRIAEMSKDNVLRYEALDILLHLCCLQHSPNTVDAILDFAFIVLYPVPHNPLDVAVYVRIISDACIRSSLCARSFLKLKLLDKINSMELLCALVPHDVDLWDKIDLQIDSLCFMARLKHEPLFKSAKHKFEFKKQCESFRLPQNLPIRIQAITNSDFEWIVLLMGHNSLSSLVLELLDAASGKSKCLENIRIEACRALCCLPLKNIDLDEQKDILARLSPKKTLSAEENMARSNVCLLLK